MLDMINYYGHIMTEQEFFKEVGKRIRYFRNQKRLTQQEVADKAQINRGDLATFENKGERIKSADIIRRIVEATGHQMSDLFSEGDEKKKELTLEFHGELAAELSNGKHEAFVSKIKETLKVLFSQEFYDGIAQDIQRAADEKELQRHTTEDQPQDNSSNQSCEQQI